MYCRLFFAFCLVSSASMPVSAQNSPAAGQSAPDTAPAAALEITADTILDPHQTYGAIVIRRSGVTIDGKGAWLVGATADSRVIPKDFRGTAILADGVSDVTLRNVNARGWETGLVIRRGSGWLIENCNFSDNFHDPDFGWGENGRRGGILLDRVNRSTLLRNRANRVWDGCVLLDSSENLLVDNDFSNCSNTCLKLWTASRNSIRHNQLSGGIRIAPGEVHARDSTSVLIESGSCDNSFLHNNCTKGGDGIFIRVLNGWCSTGNYFEGNDCSYANNNGIECWAPRNTFVANRANHCSYGFWLGGSDQTRLIGNEASFNGLPDGFHNSPHLPDSGHAGIVFMFGSSSHTIARGNICEGNHGAGIALVGDQPSAGKKWKAWHWILEDNLLQRNRWGIYGQHADWITLSQNRFADNTAHDVYWDGNVQNVIELDKTIEQPPRQTVELQPAEFRTRIRGPRVVRVGEEGRWFAEIAAVNAASAFENAPAANAPATVLPSPAQFTWKAGDRTLHEGPEFAIRFNRPGFQRIGLNAVLNGHSEPAWQDLHVVDDLPELGTEHSAAGWTITDFHERVRSDQQVSQAEFSVDRETALIGREALKVKISPYAGFRTALTWPADHSLRLPANDKLVLSFWLKAINSDVTGWQGGPFIVLHGTDDQRCYLEPAAGRDLMRELEHNEERETWRRLEIPLTGDANWVRAGELPREIHAVSCCFDSWGAPPLTIWLDGLAIAPSSH